MQPPSNRKEVQRLTGRIASLNRFISNAAERSLPFFKVLHANSVFQWGAEQQQAFEDLKKYLEEASVMTKLSPKAELKLYIAATDIAVSAMLVEELMEAEALKQFPILLRLRSLERLKTFLLGDGEDGVCSCDGKEEASTLFSKPQCIGPHSFPSSRHV
jgi:hypothetical protein